MTTAEFTTGSTTMTGLTVEAVKALVEQPKSWCVSIYMPTIAAGQETRQNSIRFKNLVREAHQQLIENGLSADEANEFCRPMTEALDQEEFWQHQDRGLAIFITDNFYRYYKLPQGVSELVVVTDQFHLKPILPLLSGDGTFYLLTLSQKDVKFFRGDRSSLHLIELPDMPTSMDEALQYDETAQDGQFRIGTSSRGGSFNSSDRGVGVFHGQGSPDRDDVTQDLLQFFHQVDHNVNNYLKDSRSPLVLAGVDRVLTSYRDANHYPHLVEPGIQGNVKVESLDELHGEAWAIVEPIFNQAIENAARYYQDLSDTNVTSTDLTETVSAAYYGRVQQLFVAVGVQRWGRFDPMANEIQIHSDPEPGDEDLLDAAAIQTLVNGGIVYAVEPKNMPDSAAIAAVFRY